MGFKLINNKSGFTIIEFTMSVVISSALVFGLSSHLGEAHNISNSLRKKQNLNFKNFEVIKRLTNDESWTKTYEHKDNESFKCLRNSGMCKDGGGTFSVYEKNESLFYDGNTNSNGFTSDGQACNAYPSSDCNFKLNLTWTPTCTQKCGSFITVVLNGKWTSSVHNDYLDPARFDFILYKTVVNPNPNPDGKAVEASWDVAYSSTTVPSTTLDEGATFSHDIVFSKALTRTTDLEVCKQQGYDTPDTGDTKGVFFRNMFNEETLANMSVPSTGCKKITVPAGSSKVTFSDIIFNDDFAYSANTNQYLMSYSIQGSKDVEVGDVGVYNVGVRDNDTYADITNIADTGSHWDITYKTNLDLTLYIYVKGKLLKVKSDANGCSIKSRFILGRSIEGKTYSLQKNCDYYPTVSAGDELYLVPSGGAAIQKTNTVVLP